MLGSSHHPKLVVSRFFERVVESARSSNTRLNTHSSSSQKSTQTDQQNDPFPMTFQKRREFKELLKKIEGGDHPKHVLLTLKASFVDHPAATGFGKEHEVGLLNQAAKWNRTATLQVLLDFWSDRGTLHLLINSRHPTTKESPLRCAALDGSVATIRLLVKYGADVDEREMYEIIRSNSSKKYMGPLFPGYKLTPDKLQKDVRKQGSVCRTPLYWACLVNNKDAIKYLLHNHSVNVNVSDECGWTPLTFAAHHGDGEIVQLLLLHGAHVNGKVSSGPELIHCDATSWRVPPHVSRVLRSRVFQSKHKHLFREWTPLWFAVRRVSLDCVRQLLKIGANPETQDAGGCTLLSWTVATLDSLRMEKQYIVFLLTSFGATVNAINNNGFPLCLSGAVGALGQSVDTWTPFSAACLLGDTITMGRLWFAGAKINYPEHDAAAHPLCLACHELANDRNVKMVVVRLLSYGANGSHTATNDKSGALLRKQEIPLQVIRNKMIHPSTQKNRRAILSEVVALLEFQAFVLCVQRRYESIFFRLLDNDTATGRAFLREIGGYLVGEVDASIVLDDICWIG